MPDETPVTNVILFFSMVCIYTVSFWFIAFEGIQVFVYLFRANAAVSRSERMADQRFSPRVLTTALWADFQAGVKFLNLFSAFGGDREFHPIAASAADGLHETVPLQRPEIPHERRALHPQPIAQLRHVPTFLGIQ